MQIVKTPSAILEKSHVKHKDYDILYV